MKPRIPKESRIRKDFDDALLDMSEGRQGVRENRRRIKKQMAKTSRLINQSELKTALDEADIDES